MPLPSPHLRPALAGVAAVAVTSAALVGATGPASAAPASPTGLQAVAPAEVAAGIPVLSWRPVPGAESYDVQLDDDSSFATPLFSEETANVAYVWTKLVPAGVQHWRVRAVGADDRVSAWSTAELEVERTPAPAPVGPADGAVLDQPAEPPLLQWDPVPAAQRYVVQLDDEDGFAGAEEYETAATSLVVPDPLSPQKDYFWRVKAVRATGIESSFSPARSFELGPLAVPEIVSPDSNPTNDLTDVVLDWRPVAGARYYDLEVSTDDDFATSTIIDSRTKITGTRYSPKVTYDNNQYYWRVRAVSSDSTVKSAWSSSVNQFRRSWPDRPTLVHPAAGASGVTDPFFYEWTPVPHATRYQLQVSTRSDFPDVATSLCTTFGTTYTPGTFRVTDLLTPVRPRDVSGCAPSTLGPTYWRVRALDDPGGDGGVQGVFSETRVFTYDPRDFVPQPGGGIFRPANRATVDVPTLVWSADQDVDTYTVEIVDANGSRKAGTTTRATSFTPPRELDPGTYTWTIRATRTNEDPGSPIYESTFTVSGDDPVGGTTPLAATSGSDTTTQRAPRFAWTPFPGAHHYRVRTYVTGTNQLAAGDAELATTNLHYPSVTYAQGFLDSGTFDWVVTAYDEDGGVIDQSARYTFSIAPLAPVEGQRLALSGSALAADQGCDAAIGDQVDSCADLPSTPVLAWEPVDGAAAYLVYVSQDDRFTNLLELSATVNTYWTPTTRALHGAVPESQAGSAYYWFVRPCKSVTSCRPSPVSVTPSAATNKFRKKSPAVTGGVATAGRAPGAASYLEDGSEVTFTWDDYAATNAATTWASGRGGMVRSPQTAMRYHVEVSATPSFATLLESADVDQPTFTSFAELYPDGPVYWRVRAVDGAENDLAWSNDGTGPAGAYVYDKSAPVPALVAPVAGQQISGSVPLQWQPLAHAEEYQVQVASANDVNFSSENLLFSETTPQTAYTWDEVIPVSAEPYVWRVRRIDSFGNLGRWSTPRRFTSTGSAPALQLPADGARVPASSALFYWTLVSGATSYRVEVREGSRTSSTTTVANAWAPTSAYDTGTRQWRVVALDAARDPIGASPYRTFSVDATAPEVVKVTPTSNVARAKPVLTVVFSERVTGVSKASVRLVKGGTTRSVPVTVVLRADRRSATVRVRRLLQRGTRYVLVLDGRIRDTSGNALRPDTVDLRTRG